MHNSRLRAQLATGIATLVVGLVGIGIVAAPASAASGPSLPVGSSLYVLSCDEDIENLSLYSVDVSTADATPVGAASPDVDSCGYQAAWDASTGVAYIDAGGNTLATVDTLSGAAVTVADFTLDGDDISVDSIAISPSGVAYAIQGNTLYSLDLATAELTTTGPIRDSTGENATIYSFAIDPTTSELIAITVDGEVFSIDPATGLGTDLGALDLSASTALQSRVYSLQIDTAGVYWLEVDALVPDGESEGLDQVSQLWSTSRATVTDPAVLVGALNVDGDTPLLESLLFVPAPVVPVIPVVPVEPAAVVVVPAAPQLANTGVDVAPIAAGGALVALLGVALMVPAIRRRRATA